MRYTIEDLKNGKVTLRNDSTLENLKKVIGQAFPYSGIPSGNNTYYTRSTDHRFWTGCVNNSDDTLPIQSCVNFLEEELKFGDDVEISSNSNRELWKGGYKFIGNDPFWGSDVIVANQDELRRLFPNLVRKPQPKVLELTIEEIAEKFGKSVSEIRIKK